MIYGDKHLDGLLKTQIISPYTSIIGLEGKCYSKYSGKRPRLNSCNLLLKDKKYVTRGALGILRLPIFLIVSHRRIGVCLLIFFLMIQEELWK